MQEKGTLYIIYPGLRCYYIYKEAQRRGYKIASLDIYDQTEKIFKYRGVKEYFRAKHMTPIELDEDFAKTMQINEDVRQKVMFISTVPKVNVYDLKLEPGDQIVGFDELTLFEMSCLNPNILKPYYALMYSCKHFYYRKIGIPFKKILNEKEIEDSLPGDFIFKPCVNAIGKRNIFRIRSKEDLYKILVKNPEYFMWQRPYMLQNYIPHVSEVWAMTFFDLNQNPYILWYSTEKGHATFSPFENDIYEKIKEINKKLKIKNWMAFIQFLILENGEVAFLDLNPRLPGDDFWHEDLYKHLTGESFAEKVLDLILDKIPPPIIKSYNYITEEEYDPSKPLLSNQKKWDYSDNYKENPVLTFKSLDLKR